MTPQEINERYDALEKRIADIISAYRKEMLEAVKPKKVAGKWYKSERSIHFIREIFDNGYSSVFGINVYDGWYDEKRAYSSGADSSEAAPSEVLEALTKEAVKLNLIGNKIKASWIVGGVSKSVIEGELFLVGSGLRIRLSDYSEFDLMRDGIWAQAVIPTPIVEKTTEEINVGTRFTFKDGSYTMSIKNKSKVFKHEFVAFKNPKVYTVIAMGVKVPSTCNPDKINDLIAVDDFGDVVFCSELNIKIVPND